MKAVIIGHSFVRRLRDEALPPPHFRLKDVAWHHSQKAISLATNLALDEVYQEVYTVSDGLVFISDLKLANSTLFNLKPELVVVDIGSNDIANVALCEPTRMLDMATQVFEFADSIQGAQAVVNAVLPRTNNISGHPSVFRQNATQYNVCLSNLCDPSFRVTFNKMRGFHGRWNEVGLEEPLPVASWSNDGIHCNATSLERYRQRIRHAMLAASHKCRA